ncbi:MAG TPA: flagellar hook-length control protein [Thermoanaerobaculia bacterium]|nr:flagellar hook-length control protein [Thermoanaerobaculia bacterium]
MNHRSAILLGTALLFLALASVQPVHASGGNGMTWAKIDHQTSLGTDRVGCAGCDAYDGETACTTALPILCLRTSSAPNPGLSTDFYNGWTGGHIAITPPVQGNLLSGPQDGDYLCRVYHGQGYQMAEFHAGGGGWNWYAYGNISDSQRFWVYINDTSGNCWN